MASGNLALPQANRIKVTGMSRTNRCMCATGAVAGVIIVLPFMLAGAGLEWAFRNDRKCKDWWVK